jgi:hypothetical protein
MHRRRTWPALALAFLSCAANAGTIKLIAYDAKGHLLDLNHFLAYIGRADAKDHPDAAKAGIVVTSPDGLAFQRPTMAQQGPLLTLSWDKLGRVRLSLPWPIVDDGFSTVGIDHDNGGFSDGDVVYLNEEIARTQYRQFKDSWVHHTKDMDPMYEPGKKAQDFADKARQEIAKAEALKDGPKRAAAFDKAIYDTSLAWETVLFEHGLQMARNDKFRKNQRFGLTLDAAILNRLQDYPWIVDSIAKTGANWVRLVFKPNPSDFLYSKQSSFSEYDAVVKELRARELHVMGTILDTNQWPSRLTPAVYAERTRNIVLHYSEQIKSWEVGCEINGDWLGGTKEPLTTDEVFKIYAAAAEQVKTIEPSLETVATLYWWDGTAPDEVHSLLGWLTRYVPRGFAKDIDVVAVSLWPEDNPVGMAFEPIFDQVRSLLPEKKLMLGSFGYVEQDALKGYWWYSPKDVDGGRKDMAILYTGAACGVSKSLCGGFWWQTLDQMMPGKHKTTDLFRNYKKTLEELGR